MAIKEAVQLTPNEISLRNYLRQLILSQGKIKEYEILDVTAFLNHQIDPQLMTALGEVIKEKFQIFMPTKVLTVESSGIAPALGAAQALHVPCIFAKKIKPITLGAIFEAFVFSHTKEYLTPVIVDVRVLKPDDRVLIVDDFLATGKTIEALLEVCQKAGAQPVGIATAIEKSFEGGREYLSKFNVPIYSAAIITSMDPKTQKFSFNEN